MEMEFKDNSRRRTLVLVVGVLLAIAAGAAAFALSSQSEAEPESLLPTREIVVAARPIAARQAIEALDVIRRNVPIDPTTDSAVTDPDEVVGEISAVNILQFQPITANLLASGTSLGAVDILKPDETVSPDSPILRAVSLSVPPDRAVGGLVGAGQRVDLLATWPMAVSIPVDELTGVVPTDPETGEPFTYTSGSATKPMWMDVEIINKNPESSLYIFRMEMREAEEVAHAQNQGASFTILLRPDEDNREVDRSFFGATTDRILERYNFPIPEFIDGLAYPQPAPFPSPFPAEPYLSPPPSAEPSPDPALVVVTPDDTGETGAGEASPAP